MNNFLRDIVAAEKRKWIYGVYSLVGLMIGCIQAGLGAVNAGTPDFLKVSLAVYAFLGTAIGATAASNTAPPKPDGT